MVKKLCTWSKIYLHRHNQVMDEEFSHLAHVGRI